MLGKTGTVCVAVSPTLVDAVIVASADGTRIVFEQEQGTPFSYIISFWMNFPVDPLIPIIVLISRRVVFFVLVVLWVEPVLNVAPVLVVNCKKLIPSVFVVVELVD